MALLSGSSPHRHADRSAVPRLTGTRLEETVSDRTGRLVTTSLAEYVVAANAEIRDVDVLFVGQPDSMTPLGTKGIGELAITGMPAQLPTPSITQPA